MSKSTPNKFSEEDYYEEAYADRRTPWLGEAYKLLADGEWHDREEIVKELAKMVPPGIAWRHAETARINQLKRNARLQLEREDYEKFIADPGNLERSQPVNEEEKGKIIRGAQRAAVLISLHASQRIEKKKEGKKILIRRIPISPRFLNSNRARIRRFQAEKGQ